MTMSSSEKPNFLTQPVVKSVFMYRNGDPFYEARRIVINQKRTCNFETVLREVTSGVRPPFGAVRHIYTPRAGHRVDCMDQLQSGEQYVAAGRERFKKIDYLQIGSRKKKMMQTLPLQFKPLPQSRIIVSARFLKPIKEPCPIFVVANGDVLNPALRLLIPQRMLGQFDRILEMVTEKMGLRILGGVRSLYTFEGQQVTDGKQLDTGQFYVAAGREKFKKLPYSELLFSKPRGTRRVNLTKAHTLPPIYRFSKQNENSKSMVRCSDGGKGEIKRAPPAQAGNDKEHLSSIVREFSQARLISLRKKKSGLSMSLSVPDNDDESKVNDADAEHKSPQDSPDEEKAAAKENVEKIEEKVTAAEATDTNAEDSSSIKEDKKEIQAPSQTSEEGATSGPSLVNGGGQKKEEAVKQKEVKQETKEKEEVKREPKEKGKQEAREEAEVNEEVKQEATEGEQIEEEVEQGTNSNDTDEIQDAKRGSDKTSGKEDKDPDSVKENERGNDTDAGGKEKENGSSGEPPEKNGRDSSSKEETQVRRGEREGAKGGSREVEREVNGEVNGVAEEGAVFSKGEGGKKRETSEHAKVNRDQTDDEESNKDQKTGEQPREERGGERK